MKEDEDEHQKRKERGPEKGYSHKRLNGTIMKGTPGTIEPLLRLKERSGYSRLFLRAENHGRVTEAAKQERELTVALSEGEGVPDKGGPV